LAKFNTFRFNKKKFNQGSLSFFTEIEQRFDIKPVVKVEFVAVDGTATDISEYYESGGVVERIKERSPDEIQAGDFDVVLKNHDNKFSEYQSTSLFYGIQYHGAKIKIYIGFKLPDGSTPYKLQQVGYIDELLASNQDSVVTLRCRDLIRGLLDQALHNRPSSETPVPGASNVGDGGCSAVQTKPFKTVDESWTLTCTTPGGSGVAVFSVVGSVSGTLASATCATEYSTGTGAGGIKFTIGDGTVDWEVGDSFTFQTRKYPQWSGVNPCKIIWSVLTGKNWDTEATESWADFVFSMDATKSDANVDIDYDTFATVIAQFSAADALTGYAAYGESTTEFLQSILLSFLGSIYTGGDGRIRLQSFQPVFGGGARLYSDDKKIMRLGYNRVVSEILNSVSVKYKSRDVWQFSDEEVEYEGLYVAKDADSISRYGTSYAFEASLKWYSNSGVHAQDFANRLIQKYKDPPLVVEFETGADGIISEIGDRTQVTDEKYGFSELNCEISRMTKKFDSQPITVAITARRDGDLDLRYGFLGSRIDEGDGLSPQASTFGAASDSDKLFCYLSSGYRMF
jgi:hypothetical protein